jgi:hypothetical protein
MCVSAGSSVQQMMSRWALQVILLFRPIFINSRENGILTVTIKPVLLDRSTMEGVFNATHVYSATQVHSLGNDI